MTTKDLLTVFYNANEALEQAKEDYKDVIDSAVDAFVDANPNTTGNDIKAIKAIAKAKAALKLEELQAYTETLNNQIGELS